MEYLLSAFTKCLRGLYEITINGIISDFYLSASGLVPINADEQRLYFLVIDRNKKFQQLIKILEKNNNNVDSVYSVPLEMGAIPAIQGLGAGILWGSHTGGLSFCSGRSGNLGEATARGSR